MFVIRIMGRRRRIRYLRLRIRNWIEMRESQLKEQRFQRNDNQILHFKFKGTHSKFDSIIHWISKHSIFEFENALPLANCRSRTNSKTYNEIDLKHISFESTAISSPRQFSSSFKRINEMQSCNSLSPISDLNWRKRPTYERIR